ncbi:hypothetical protein COLO4_08407 [Corchorus olitorius]|uniref:Uncharacterized protein n=1 Tax=Corchorus olitorius TaxID=93759 RepID=A0A1R3KG09_9ROSI|nr:hypothetical protein COLO4_08407 [Corchorus olitorius]
MGKCGGEDESRVKKKEMVRMVTENPNNQTDDLPMWIEALTRPRFAAG